ncbi:alanine/glycine:cation symporter family protein [Marinibactrum halimedae]|uniref:Sodium:alanine symporter n=1 Tax=Marinibactrum halimedae TaxID=1444977 RepID=A0AA37T4U2_9GAMM|nr:amino acid carrier protein [Marinibactrum halimedae]MCD9460325.1 amino acid carrier protein [Marinibactrum halimedae]GLS26759.1 sodium:alanine symporter [Marinibactrum halimedae]
MLQTIEDVLVAFSDFIWGTPLLALILAGGAFFVVYSRLLPYLYFGHAFKILRGDYNDPNDQGDISHFQALSSALSGTLGLGNIAGVAVAIAAGGPGAIFWMWATALVGVGTKFFTASLSVMYRGKDSQGKVQGGPMYVIETALGKRWKPLAMFFCVAAMFGTLPVFQINQLTQIVRDVIAVPAGWTGPEAHLGFDIVFGSLVAALVAVVIFGGVKRVAATAERIVPIMVVGYLLITCWVLISNASAIPSTLLLIVQDAFSGSAVAGGLLGTMIIGVRQGTFSNEAGIGTESLAHGAVKTQEPIREGLVAMVGPIVDTIVVCTCTALVILMTGVWETGSADGVTLTAKAFETSLGSIGPYLLIVLVFFFSISTMFTFWYYGTKCLSYLVGADRVGWYRYAYVGLVIAGAVVSVKAVVALMSGMYALMAIPTMLSSFILAPKVMEAAKDYFSRY